MSNDEMNSTPAGEQRLSREEQSSIEAILATAGPRGARVDRDRLMFLAGRASVGGTTDTGATADDITPRRQEARRDSAWRTMALAMTAVSAALAIALFASRHADSRVARGPDSKTSDVANAVKATVDDGNAQSKGPEHILQVDNRPSAMVGKFEGSQHFRLREIVLRDGVESLPDSDVGDVVTSPLSASYLRQHFRPDGNSTSGNTNAESVLESTTLGDQL